MILAYGDGSVDLLYLVHVPPATVVQLLGALIPFLVALVTKRYAQSWVKAATSLVSTGLLAGVAVLVTADGHYNFMAFWQAFTDALLANVIVYVLLRTSVVLRVAERTADVGLGTNQLVPVTGDVAATPSGAVVTVYGPDVNAMGSTTASGSVNVVRTGGAFAPDSGIPPLMSVDHEDDRP
jgi:hypothetical protein